MNIKQLIKRFVLSFFMMITIYICCYSVITYSIFGNYSMPLNYIAEIGIIAFGTSLILTLILSFDKLFMVLQAILVYLIIIISVYLVGFYTGFFISNYTFWKMSILINAIALILYVGFVVLRSYLINKKLNDELKSYKEREK